MRFLLISLLALILFYFPLSGQHDNTQTSLSHHSTDSLSLIEFLEDLEKMYKVDFAFESTLNPEKIFVGKPISGSLEETLIDVLKDLSLEFDIQDDVVLLRPSLTNSNNLISGNIIDGVNGKVLPYSVLRDSQGKQWYADSLGHFDMIVDQSNFPDSIYITFLGYAEKGIATTDLSRKNILALQPVAHMMPVIRILSPVFPAEMLRLNVIQSMHLLQNPSTLLSGDVIRSIQLEAGITAHKDISSQIEVRGSEAFETMINLDGIVIYNPTHFYNLFSAINGAYIQGTSLYKNNFPIEFAGRTGGLVAIQSRDLSNPSFHIKGFADLLNSSLSLEIPLGKKTGLLVAGRSSYTDLTQSGFLKTISGNTSTSGNFLPNDNLVQQLTPSFNFYDFNTKIQKRFNNNHQLDLNFFYSQDRYSNLLKSTLAPRQNISEYLFDYNDKSNWGNLGASANYIYSSGPKRQSKFTIQYSQANSSDDFSFTNSIQSRGFTKEFDYTNELSNSIKDFHLVWLNKLFLSGNTRYSYGFETGYYETSSLIVSDSNTVMNRPNDETVLSIFQEYSGGSSTWTYQIGLRLGYLLNNNNWVLDPRFTLNYKPGFLSGNIYTAFSINHQYLTQFTYENRLGVDYSFWVLPDEVFPILSSYNAMFGYKLTRENFKLNAEFYYKHRTGLTEYAIQKPGIPDGNNPANESFQFFYGNGNIIGLDLSMSKRFGAYQTHLNYTLSRNMVAFDEIFGGKYYPDADHRTHQLKFINNYSYHQFSFQANLIYSSGKPYLDVSKLNNDKSRKELKSEDHLSYLPPYIRLDAGITYSPTYFNDKLSIGLSVFNLLNRRNVYNIQFIKPFNSNPQNQQEYIPVGAESNLLERTINLQVLFNF